MNGDLIAMAQTIVDGPWQHATRARSACQSGSWTAFVNSVTPPAPILWGRWDLASCRELAAGTCEEPKDVVLRIFPLWVGENPSEEPAASWYLDHAMSIDDQPLSVIGSAPIGRDADPAIDRPTVCEARVWRAAVVVEARSYSAEVPMLLRQGSYGVLAMRIVEILRAESASGEALPRPNITVPPFCTWCEPRAGGLDRMTALALRALSLTFDEEGQMVSRPLVHDDADRA
jgi:hypothetical protein